ncbi:hypothetical protein P7C73_g876, partial [Tremellales sp. Uapishka_1]
MGLPSASSNLLLIAQVLVPPILVVAILGPSFLSTWPQYQKSRCATYFRSSLFRQTLPRYLQSTISPFKRALWFAVSLCLILTHAFQALTIRESWVVARSVAAAIVWATLLLFIPVHPPPHLVVRVLVPVQWLISLIPLLSAFHASLKTAFPFSSWSTLLSLPELLNSLFAAVLLVLLLSLPRGSPEVFLEDHELDRKTMVDRHAQALRESGYSSASLEVDASIFSHLMYGWIWPILRKGYRGPMRSSDLMAMPHMLTTFHAKTVLDSLIQEDRGQQEQWLWRALWRLAGWDVIVSIFWGSIGALLAYVGPMLMREILRGINERSRESLADSYLYSVLSLGAVIGKAVSDRVSHGHSRQVGANVKSALVGVIFAKALTRPDSSGHLGRHDESGKSGAKATDVAMNGKIVQMMDTDPKKIAQFTALAMPIFTTPTNILVPCLLLYYLMGWSALIGVSALILAVPLHAWLSSRSTRLQRAISSAKDARLQLMSELMLAIKTIKLFAWEDYWTSRVAEVWSTELKHMRANRVNQILLSLVWTLAPMLHILVSFASFVYIAKRDLTVDIAFTAISLFMMLRSPLAKGELPTSPSSLSHCRSSSLVPLYKVTYLQSRVACSRIQDFLDEPDRIPMQDTARTTAGQRAMAFENATIRWGPSQDARDVWTNTNESLSGSSTTLLDSRAFELSNVNHQFPIGKFSVITGPTGSGKTASLMSLLGEMTTVSGTVYGTLESNPVAYASQTPWLQYMTVKENILFGHDWDSERYEATLDCCCLRPDLDILPDGDGVTLSGGQKARVALARAVYSAAETVLLDDPLAAVDIHVARELVQKCFKGRLLKNRTVVSRQVLRARLMQQVLVTHHIDLLLPAGCVDYVVGMDKGTVEIQGTPESLRDSGDLSWFEAEAQYDREHAASPDWQLGIVPQSHPARELRQISTTSPTKTKSKTLLVKDEGRTYGPVRLQSFVLYLSAAPWWLWGAAVVFLGSRYWLKVWGERSHIRHMTSATPSDADQHSFALVHGVSLPDSEPHVTFYLLIFALLTLGEAGSEVLQAATLLTGTLTAASNLHNDLFASVTTATHRWYDVNPAGRVLNLFADDLNKISNNLGLNLQKAVVCVGSFTTALVLLIVVVRPLLVIPIACFLVGFYYLGIHYLRAARDIRRMASTSRSPVFTGLGEMLDGLAVVRAFRAEDRFLMVSRGMTMLDSGADRTTCEQELYRNQSYIWRTCNRWLALYFEVLGGFFTFGVTIAALQGASAGLTGIAIVSAQAFVSALTTLAHDWTSMEQAFNSVERIHAYLAIPHEIVERDPSHSVPLKWPSTLSKTLVSIRDLSVRYSPELPDVLQQVSFDIMPGERIAVVGRTGSGKSTLAMSLLEFVEPSGGSIVLDGVDIASLGTKELRSSITYIPQDSVIFSGTLRDNLDPFHQYSDNELHDALNQVGLAGTFSLPASRKQSPGPSTPKTTLASPDLTVPSSPTVASYLTPPDSLFLARAADKLGTATPRPVSLETRVAAGGANWSQGQRQLVSMARAILRQSALVIMDEATSAIDFRTDTLLQQAIVNNFKASGLITIAHRLQTVVKYDKILVLDQGKVVEFASPKVLLETAGSYFATMVEQSGQGGDLKSMIYG